MGKMNFGHDGSKEFKQVAKKVMEDHRDTFERLAKHDISEPVVLEKEVHHHHNTVEKVVEKQQDIHHHTTVHEIKTSDKKARQYSKAIRNEFHNLLERSKQLQSVQNRAFSSKMERIETKILELQSNKPEQKQVVIESKEIKYVLDKRLVVLNGILLLVNLGLLLFK